jgi:DNA-binding MurR/RpiR family transcriptional regulator
MVHAESPTLLAALSTQLNTLPPAERRVANVIMGYVNELSSFTIQQIAKLADTSTTSVIRLCRRLGYRRFTEFRFAIAADAGRQDILTTTFAAEASDVTAEDSVEQLVAKLARDEARSLSDTARFLSIADLEASVLSLLHADRIALFGLGASATVAEDLHRKLARIGMNSTQWAESDAAIATAATLSSQSVAVGISHTGETVDVSDFLSFARAQGATTVAITNAPNSSVAGHADHALYTMLAQRKYRSGALGSRLAQLFIIDCIYMALVNSDSERANAALRATYQAVSERRSRK